MKEEKKETKEKTEEKSDVEQIKKDLEACLKEREEFLRGWQRERADFLNYKKEESERIKSIIRHANEEFILKILPVLDNFEKAEKEIPEKFKEDQYFKGLLQIKIQLLDFLKNQGVKEVESLGKKFDPNFHEVIEEVKIKDKESGIVVEELQKGYILEDKLLRPAKVKVSK